MIKLEPLLLQTQGEKCESGRQQGRGAGCWQLGNHQLRRCRMFNMRGSASRASERASGERLDPVGKIQLGFLKNQSLATQSRFTQDSPGQSSWRLNSGFTKQSRKIRPGNCKREHTGVAWVPPPPSWEPGGGRGPCLSGCQPLPAPPHLPVPTSQAALHPSGFAVPSISSGAAVLRCARGPGITEKRTEKKSTSLQWRAERSPCLSQDLSSAIYHV